MNRRQELIKILECCSDVNVECRECPNAYKDGRAGCEALCRDFRTIPADIIKEVIALLKEQEPEKVFHVADRSINETHGKTGFCPRCNQVVIWGVNRRHCGFCGKELIWDV